MLHSKKKRRSERVIWLFYSLSVDDAICYLLPSPSFPSPDRKEGQTTTTERKKDVAIRRTRFCLLARPRGNTSDQHANNSGSIPRADIAEISMTSYSWRRPQRPSTWGLMKHEVPVGPQVELPSVQTTSAATFRSIYFWTPGSNRA